MSSPREIRYYRAAGRFMPRLWDFAYPIHHRNYRAARRIALKAWSFAFVIRCRLSEP